MSLLFLPFLVFMQPATPAPEPFADLERFPSRETADDGLHQCRARIKWIGLQMEFDPRNADEWEPCMREAHWNYWLWDNLADAHNQYAALEWRLAALAALREKLSPEDYRAGRMPARYPDQRPQPKKDLH